VHEIAKLSSRIEHAVAELPDGQIVMSFPRAGRICAGQILSELGNLRERFQTEDQLAAEAGVAPVTHASGKSRGVVFRWACNRNLRVAITCFADNSRHGHAHAVRILARAWVRVLWRAWQDGEAYDPAKHKAAVQIG
jgi:transposase